MRGSAFIAFFGIATALSGALVGCGDDSEEEAAAPAKIAKSGEGETCTRSDDCDKGLACFGNVCLQEPSGTGGTDGTGGSATGGKGGTSPTLGGEGESCTKRSDCNTGLSCFNQRCTSGTGEGGGGNTPTQGARGETCVLSSDCEAPLICLPDVGTRSIGVCTDAESDITPSGMVCGAECIEPADCCGIPVELQASIGVKSCTDLADVLDGVTCSATTTGQNATRCFVDEAYCSGCGTTNWDCTAGVCNYKAVCSASGLLFEGCPTYSRIGRPLIGTCDTADTERCQAHAVDPVCTVDDDCDTLAVSDDPADTCNAGECTCFAQTCLRRCDSDLDCRVGYMCDTGDDVCVPEDACSSDVTCQERTGDIRAACLQNTCTRPCQFDLDCNALTGGLFRSVCNAGMCESIGCNDETDCASPYMNGTKTFCTRPEAAAGARAAQSAITD